MSVRKGVDRVGAIGDLVAIADAVEVGVGEEDIREVPRLVRIGQAVAVGIELEVIGSVDANLAHIYRKLGITSRAQPGQHMQPPMFDLLNLAHIWPIANSCTSDV